MSDSLLLAGFHIMGFDTVSETEIVPSRLNFFILL